MIEVSQQQLKYHNNRPIFQHCPVNNNGLNYTTVLEKQE